MPDEDYADARGVDEKLLRLAEDLPGRLVTNDFNLNKVAQIRDITVLNINELVAALQTVALPGELLRVHVLKEGKEAGQGVAYLDDGTMVVVEDGTAYIGIDIDVRVTTVLQTPAGRMIFARCAA